MRRYVGKTKYNDVNIDFELEDLTLKLFVPGDVAKDILWQEEGGKLTMRVKKPLNVETLSGCTNDEKYQIKCYFKSDNYGMNSKTMGLGKTTIIIPLIRYIVYDLYKPRDKFYMIYYSKQMHYFTNLMPNFQYDNQTFFFKCDFPSTNLIARAEIDDYDFEMVPTYICNWNGPKIDFTPGIKIEFNKALDERRIEKFYETFLYFIRYSFMRMDMFPDKFEFSNGSFCGEIISNGKVSEEVEDLTSVYRDSFSWELLHTHAGELFKLIYCNAIHILNTQEKKALRLYVSLESISKDSAAFEAEFDSTYLKGIPCSDERKQIEEEIRNEITPLMENSSGKKRKIYKGFIRHLHIESLADKIEYAFKEYMKSIQLVKSRLRINYTPEALGEYCSKIRNDVDHGNRIDAISDEVVNSFILLRCLIYAMQLKKAGYSDEEIDGLINLLYQIKGLPL